MLSACNMHKNKVRFFTSTSAAEVKTERTGRRDEEWIGIDSDIGQNARGNSLRQIIKYLTLPLQTVTSVTRTSVRHRVITPDLRSLKVLEPNE